MPQQKNSIAKLSDAELDAMIAKKQGGNGKLSEMSDEELDRQIAAKGGVPEPSFLERAGTAALNGVVKVGSAIDSVTGAPTRAAISALQDEKNPLSAFVSQFAADPKLAPTGKDIAAKAGLSTAEEIPFPTLKKAADIALLRDWNINPEDPEQFSKVSPAGMAGVGIDFVADPVNLLPLVDGARLAQKAVGAIGEGAKMAAGGIGRAAEKLAVNATGATGAQASKFAENAGRELLDRGVVKFGDTAGGVAKRAGKVIDQGNARIDKSLKALDEMGATVDLSAIGNSVRDKISSLMKDPSKARVAKNLEAELENLIKSAEAHGTSQIPISYAERVKRGYNKMAGNWADPASGEAGKEMYRAFLDAVEDSARVADPKLAEAFKGGKETYGLLSPIEEAASRRAATQNQWQVGGLMDLLTGGGGAAAAGPAGAIAAPLLRRMIAPRLASSGAITLDMVAGQLRKVPSIAQLEIKNPGAFESLVRTVGTQAGPEAVHAADTNEASLSPIERRMVDIAVKRAGR